MDNFTIHLAPLPRRFPRAPAVQSVGYLPEKTGRTARTFQTFNFSFILRGAGEYRTPEGVWTVRAPCVITQWPGAHLVYGPEESWEELYLIYSAECMSALQELGLARRGRRHWRLAAPGPVAHRLAELHEALAGLSASGAADRVDRLCELLLVESLLSAEAAGGDPRARAVRTVRAYLEEHYAEPVVVDDLAVEQGLSPSHFRRLWRERVGPPPWQYVLRLRVQRACRYLVETDLPVGEVAAAVGFEDALYFSRRFKRETGLSPTEYRRQQQGPVAPRGAQPRSKRKTRSAPRPGR